MASYRKSTTKAGTQRWQSVWQQPGPNGKSQRRTKNFGSQKEARAHAQLMEREERRGVGDPQKHSLERYLKRWLATLNERGERSPSTMAFYRRQVDMACKHIGHVLLEKLGAADLDGLYNLLLRQGGTARKANPDGSRDARPLAARTVSHVHRTLHVALEQARKWKMIPENPAKDATAPTPRKGSIKAFTQDEVARLMEAAASDRVLYIMLVTLLITGARRSELLGSALDAIDLDAGTFTIKRVLLEVDHVAVLREDTRVRHPRARSPFRRCWSIYCESKRPACSQPRWHGARATGANRCSCSRGRTASR
jgi:integrase